MSTQAVPPSGFSPSPSDSGITLAFGATPHASPGEFNLEFRRELAAWVIDVLTRAYGPQREFVVREAHRRHLTVEQLLAAYLVRVIMDKVDNEYI